MDLVEYAKAYCQGIQFRHNYSFTFSHNVMLTLIGGIACQ